MNKRHAVVAEAGRTIVVTEDEDPVLQRRLIVRSSLADIRNFYMNRRVTIPGGEGSTQYKALGDLWLKAPDRRQYAGIVFSPVGDVPGRYNLWRGFAVDPKEGDWSLLHEHIYAIICRKQPDLFRWVQSWMADTVQHPDSPAEVALVMRGARGAGKGFVGRALASVFAPHSIQVSNPRHLLGNFNAHLQDAVVVFADEAFIAGDRQAEGTLKMMITEPTIPIERKHRDVVTAKNVIHLIIASNDSWVVPAGLDERRFCVLDVSDERAQDHNYFGAIQQQLDAGGLSAMLHDLRRFDCSGVNLRQPPTTDGLLDQKVHSLDPLQRWWFDKLHEGRLLPDHDVWNTEVLREALCDDYSRTVAGTWAHGGRATCTELGIRLKRLLPAPYPLARQPTSQDRKRAYVFPALEECRRHFTKLMGGRYPWSPS
jgi:Family of unknown function (DUF5906)